MQSMLNLHLAAVTLAERLHEAERERLARVARASQPIRQPWWHRLIWRRGPLHIPSQAASVAASMWR